MPSIDLDSVLLKVKTQGARKLIQATTAKVDQQIFIPAAERLYRDFLEHPVTQELEAGLFASNISKTLVGVRSSATSNLFSFIGFEGGSQPVEIIKQYLNYNSPLGPTIKYIEGSARIQNRNVVYSFSVNIPDLNLIYRETPLPWAPGISWVKRLEDGGIPGLGSFLAEQNERSRSGGGLQIKTALNKAIFKTRPYLSVMVATFISTFKGTVRKPTIV